MNGLRKKLRDQSGASILLALLFFLLCGMVGASVLMAAASNAGKARSGREEQRKYLLLSSALRLACDQLTSAEYYGTYAYGIRTEDATVSQPDGSEIPVTHTYYEYTQKEGSLRCGLEDTLPLTEELDQIFASKFPNSRDSGTDHYIYTPKSGAFTSNTHELTLHADAPDVEGLDGAANTVTVKVKMDQDLRIRLTAALGEEADGYLYTMEAQLTGKGSALNLTGAKNGTNSTEAVTWSLEWIAKKEAGDVT